MTERTFHARVNRSWRDCEACGDRFRAKMAEQRACSRWCGHYIKYSRWPSSPVRQHQPLIEPKPLSRRVFLPDCAICGRIFATPYTVTTCSPRCRQIKRRAVKRLEKDKRRALKKNAYVADVHRQAIFERDRWRCHICGKDVDRTKTVPHSLAPTIDHLVPLARGGTHEPSNVGTAHYLCNSTKAHHGGGEQLLLIG